MLPFLGDEGESPLPPVASEVTATFAKLGYFPEKLRQGEQTPRLFMVSLPRGIEAIEEPAERKLIFIGSLLPSILKVNEEILAERKRLQEIRTKKELTPEEKDWLEDVADRYKGDMDNIPALLVKVNVIPPSLALAQSALESGWGSSRFARDGNALFGQWTTDDDKGAIIPKERNDNETHAIKRFDSLITAVRSYALNLNTHNAYRELRKARAEAMKQHGRIPSGLDLAGQLNGYSEQGEDYVRLVRILIKVNALGKLDNVKLAPKT